LSTEVTTMIFTNSKIRLLTGFRVPGVDLLRLESAHCDLCA
jgi:hypothetical protein